MRKKFFDVKKFFKNQRDQFDKALKQLDIYEKNKTYVLDPETINIVKEIETIVKSPKPYNQISKLPSLINEFVEQICYAARRRVQTCKGCNRKVIGTRLRMNWNCMILKDELAGAFSNKFRDLLDRLDSSHNFYEAIAMKEESDRLKMRCFEEIKKTALEKSKERASDRTSG
ncbi:MAG: hypothetical protein ACOX4N_02610 [Dethiobacteraceae bacterium]